MRPKIVYTAEKAPGQCLVSQDLEGPFIDAGCWAPWRDPYVYLSCRWLEEVARDQLNMFHHEKVDEKIAEMQAQLDAYAEEMEKMRNLSEAAEGLQSALAEFPDRNPEEAVA